MKLATSVNLPDDDDGEDDDNAGPGEVGKQDGFETPGRGKESRLSAETKTSSERGQNSTGAGSEKGGQENTGGSGRGRDGTLGAEPRANESPKGDGQSVGTGAPAAASGGA